MDEFDSIYQENILDHYKHPHHKGALSLYDEIKEGANPSCGDELTLFVKYETDRVVDVGYVGDGCAISQASMSMLSDHLIGKSKTEIATLTEKDIYSMLGIPIGPEREKCALLSLRTLQQLDSKHAS